MLIKKLLSYSRLLNSKRICELYHIPNFKFNSAMLVKNDSQKNNNEIFNYKYLIINNTPDYWNETFLNSKLEDIGEIEFIANVKHSLKSLEENKNINDNNKNENSFVVKLKSLNEEKCFKKLENIITDHKNIHFEFSKSLNINQVNLSQPSKFKNILLVYSKNATKVLDLPYIKEFISKNENEVSVKPSHFGKFVYLWFKSQNLKQTLEKTLTSYQKEIYFCNSKPYYSVSKVNDYNGITFNSTEKDDLMLLRDLNSKIEVLKCINFPNSEVIKKELIERLNSLRYLLKEKDYLPSIKPYTIVGSNGVVLYDI